MTPSVVTAISAMPASRPSRPSTKLTLLSMPTIHSVVAAIAASVADVAAIEHERRRPSGLGRRSMRMPRDERDAGEHELADELPARAQLQPIVEVADAVPPTATPSEQRDDLRACAPRGSGGAKSKASLTHEAGDTDADERRRRRPGRRCAGWAAVDAALRARARRSRPVAARTGLPAASAGS